MGAHEHCSVTRCDGTEASSGLSNGLGTGKEHIAHTTTYTHGER